MEKIKTAVLISGRGSNLTALVKAAKAPDYPAEIALVIANRPEAPGLNFAKDENIKIAIIDHTKFAVRETFDQAMQAILDEEKIELICLAGFMRLLTDQFVNHWAGRMLNIHPSLLPSFKGLHTHARAIAEGVKITGCTVHLVTPKMDEGEILGQAATAILKTDTAETLEQRVLKMEHRLYPAVLKKYIQERLLEKSSQEKIISFDENQNTLFSPWLDCND